LLTLLFIAADFTPAAAIFRRRCIAAASAALFHEPFRRFAIS
jgi:hypothetical protein